MADEVDGGAAAAGTAADILGTAAAAATGADGGAAAGAEGGAADGGTGAEGGAGDGGADGGADPDWYANLSADADGDKPSLRDWVKATGVKDLEGLAKVARDNQAALRESGRIKIPGEGAKPEELAEFRKAIGVPAAAAEYTVTAPKDDAGNDLPLNDELIGRMAESALKHGAPKAVFEGIVSDFIQAQLDEAAEIDTAQKQLAEDTVKGWGKDKDANLAAIDNAARALGIDRNKMVALRNALGADFALDMMAKLGKGMAEDVMITGGSNRFGISGAEAVQEIARLKTDGEFQKKLMAGDPASVARWNRLNEAEAAYEEAKRKAA
jgi:hypothetical protein